MVGIAGLLEVTGVFVAHPVVNLVFTTVSAGQRGQLTLLLIGMVSLLAVGLVGSGYGAEDFAEAWAAHGCFAPI